MKEKSRQFFKNSAYTYLGFILGGLTLIFIFPAILSPEQVGLLQVINSYATVFLYFLALGFPYSILRFFPNFSDEQRKTYLSYSLILTTSLCLLLIAGAFFLKDLYLPYLSDRSELYTKYFNYFSIISIGLVLFEIIASVFRIYDYPTIPSFFREIGIRLINIIICFLYYKGWISFDAVVVLYALSGLLALAGLIFIGLNKKVLSLGKPRFAESKREFLMYGVFSFLGIGTVTLAIELDTIIIFQLTNDLGAIARYKIAFFIAMIISLPTRALFPIMHPQISRAFYSNDLQAIERLYKVSSRNLFFIGSVISALILIHAPQIELVLPEKYRGLQNILFIICAARWIDTVTGINGVILVQSSRYKADFVINIALLVISVLANLVFVNLLGITGGATATLISLAAYNIIRILYIHKYYKIHPFEKSNLYNTLIFILVTIGLYHIPSTGSIVFDIAIKTTLLTLFVLILLIKTRLAPESTEFLLALHKKYILRKY
jgi:O-antigen/teichoic acid export membrane protein